MTKVTNITTGPKGVRPVKGDVIMLEPGQSADVDLAEGEDGQTEWFSFEDEDATSEPGPLDQSVEKLIAYLETVTDADEVEKLIEAETAGKSRSSALAALNDRRDAILAD
jgi:hypothetical protein